MQKNQHLLKPPHGLYNTVQYSIFSLFSFKVFEAPKEGFDLHMVPPEDVQG